MGAVVAASHVAWGKQQAPLFDALASFANLPAAVLAANAKFGQNSIGVSSTWLNSGGMRSDVSPRLLAVLPKPRDRSLPKLQLRAQEPKGRRTTGSPVGR